MSDNLDLETTTEPPLTEALTQLVAIVARLRAPDGCPWDRAQTHASIASNLTEEAAEAAWAIERGDLANLREELGDVLLQVLLQAQIASDNQEFTLQEVVEGLSQKLVRRHPHVFGITAALDATELSPTERQDLAERAAVVADKPEEVLKLWDSIKLLERRQSEDSDSLLASVPATLPALLQAADISRKAIAAGFDWDTTEAVWQQAYAEIAEYQAETAGSAAAAAEFGDILFALVNVGLRSGINAESALRGTISRFRERWTMMESYAAAEGRELASYPVATQEAFWQRAKQQLAAGGGVGASPDTASAAASTAAD
ncbi:MAG: nucleoside triphosphate pyrophosphohydrolase [Actinomycetia bacterium]|nr:nucleoside triphosphate pyrophosphohydrolase [Actinomycetes bacterium]